jgi:hypothetical protein
MKTIKITSYYIDENNTMHTYCGDLKHITISDVMSEEEAEELIYELNDELENNTHDTNN